MGRDPGQSAVQRGSVEVQPDLYRGQRIGKYEILSLLTMGGMAELFLAFTAGPGGFRKYFVIKRILPDIRSDEQFVKMFLDEARITAAFNHPNIAQVYDLGEEEDGLYLAMEFIAGQNLNQITSACRKRRTPLPVGFSAMVARDVCLALHYAHTFADPTGQPFPVIHRDVAQKNVMVAYDGTTKLLDFGIAKAKVKLGRTRNGMVKGTTGYMSPEQVTNGDLDGRSDLFSVGVMLHELLLGKRLFAAETESEEMRQILNGPVAVPTAVIPEIPTELSRVTMRALARNREDRFRTARDMAKALEQAAGKLLFERDQASSFMRELFEERLKATQALLEAAGGQWKRGQMEAVLKVLTEDAGANFPGFEARQEAPAPTAPAPDTKEDHVAQKLSADLEQRSGMAGRGFGAGPIVVLVVLTSLAALAFGLFRWFVTPAPEPPPAYERHPRPLGPVPTVKEFTEPTHAPPAPAAQEAPAEAVAQEPSKPDAGHHAPVAKTGTLTLVTVPECKVWRSGKLLGKTPLFNASLPEGTHLLRLVGPDGKARLLSVQIKPEHNARFRFVLADLPTER